MRSSERWRVNTTRLRRRIKIRPEAEAVVVVVETRGTSTDLTSFPPFPSTEIYGNIRTPRWPRKPAAADADAILPCLPSLPSPCLPAFISPYLLTLTSSIGGGGENKRNGF